MLVASLQNVGKPVMTKHVTLILVNGITATYKGESFVNSWSGFFLSSKHVHSRLTGDEDNAIRFLSALNAKESKNQPSWELDLKTKLDHLGMYSYEPPGSEDNVTRCVYEFKLKHSTEILTAPGACVFQCITNTLPNLLKMLQGTIDVGILGQGLVFIVM